MLIYKHRLSNLTVLLPVHFSRYNPVNAINLSSEHLFTASVNSLDTSYDLIEDYTIRQYDLRRFRLGFTPNGSVVLLINDKMMLDLIDSYYNTSTVYGVEHAPTGFYYKIRTTK